MARLWGWRPEKTRAVSGTALCPVTWYALVEQRHCVVDCAGWSAVEWNGRVPLPGRRLSFIARPSQQDRPRWHHHFASLPAAQPCLSGTRWLQLWIHTSSHTSMVFGEQATPDCGADCPAQTCKDHYYTDPSKPRTHTQTHTRTHTQPAASPSRTLPALELTVCML